MLFYFDIGDGDDLMIDNEGSDLKSREHARREAIALLPDIARDELPDGDHHTFSVSVRNQEGKVIFEASLTLAAGWVDHA